MPLNHDTSWSGLDVTGSSFKIRIPDKLENSSFEGEKVSIEAEYRAREDSNSVNISQCVFIADTVRFEQEQNVWNSISRSLVTGHFENCFRILDRITFANETGTAVENIRRNAVIMNSFFFGYDTLVSGDSSFIDYSAYLNMEDQPVFGRNVTVGENFLGERNPRFVDPDAGDYHLQSGSDLIDAGNPDSDPDPDGTRADIGAYFFDQTDVEDFDNSTTIPYNFAIVSVYPNPFNGQAYLNVRLHHSVPIKLTINDILGKEIAKIWDGKLKKGQSKFSLNMNDHPSGIYFIRLVSPGYFITKKALLIKQDSGSAQHVVRECKNQLRVSFLRRQESRHYNSLRLCGFPDQV